MEREIKKFKSEIDQIHQSMISVKSHHFKTYVLTNEMIKDNLQKVINFYTNERQKLKMKFQN